MARTRSRHRRARSLGPRLLLLPLRLPLVLTGWSVRRVLAFRPVRVAVYALLVAIAVLVVEAAEFKRTLPHLSKRDLEVAVAITYAASLCLFASAWRWLACRRRLRVRRFEALLALTPIQFEQEMGRLLHDLGYRDVEHVGGAGDLAADLRCRDRAGKTVIVQCKRYAPGRRVGSGEMQSFIGMMTVHHQAERGIYVTTAEFTQPATQLAGLHAVELFDGPRLSRLVGGSRQ